MMLLAGVYRPTRYTWFETRKVIVLQGGTSDIIHQAFSIHIDCLISSENGMKSVLGLADLGGPSASSLRNLISFRF